MASASGVKPYPSCLLCGVEVPSMIHSQNMNPPRSTILFGANHRMHYRIARPGHVVIPSKEVEEAELQEFPRIWSCMCRAIMKGPNTKYFLSGITAIRTDYTRPYIVPKNPNMARIGGRTPNLQYNDTFVQFYAASIRRQPNEFKDEDIGFVVHAHCWALLNHIVPTNLIERKLEKFICAAQKYWRGHELWGSNDPMLRLVKQYDLLHAHSEPKSPFKYGCDIYKNPLIVPEIQLVIERARKAGKKNSQPRYTNYSHVPLDVAILIAERICPIHYTLDDVKNTQNMISAWQWTLPDGFWKRRLKEEDILFELESLREADYSIDWQSLRLDLMALVSDRNWYKLSGLANRVRMLSFMTAITSNFLEMP